LNIVAALTYARLRGILRPIKSTKRKMMIMIQLRLKGNWRTSTNAMTKKEGVNALRHWKHQ